MKKTVNLDELKKSLLASGKTRAEYDALANEFRVAHALIAARKKAKLSQQDVAARMKTTQSTIARMESGKHAPSMSSIEKYATAVGYPIKLEIIPIDDVASA